MSLEKKLRFLYEHGREEQVGAYFRNQNLTDVTPENSFGKFFWDFVTLDLGEEGLQDSVSHVNGGPFSNDLNAGRRKVNRRKG